MKVVQGAGKFFGKVVAVSKAAPAKTKSRVVSAKSDLVAGFNQGAQRTSDSDVIDI